jgi:tryptophan-rich sensory protein
MALRVLLFLILNFAALAIGGIFTGAGVQSGWYANANLAPWTPPGWVFGAAWTLIMICYAFYMGAQKPSRNLIIVYTLQWVLNVAWNPLFFYLHEVLLALLVITLLTLLVWYSLFQFRHTLKLWSILILPYAIWLVIATSLNAYILLMN